MEKLKVLMLAMTMVLLFSAVALCDWNPEDPAKWIQMPDLTETGIDICVDDTGDIGPRTIGDDFQCTETGPITDVHLWGSWLNDDKGQITAIHLSFYTDDPVGDGGTDPDNEYSKPDVLKWERWFDSSQFVERSYYKLTDGVYEGWWDPREGASGYIPDGDTEVWQINIDILEEPFFIQEGTPDEPVIYWLVVQVKIDQSIEGTSFGWKTRDREDGHFMDDAVWMGFDWVELRYPQGHLYYRDSIDMAFVITGREEEPEHDFGDAPDYTPTAKGYPTLLANNGAFHVIGGPWLGDDNDMPDDEPDGQPDAAATGDDNDGNDDEDGVQLFDLTPGITNLITVEVNGGGGYLSIWVDWNGDMDWDDAGERAYTSSSPLGDGDHFIPLTPPVTSVTQTFLRARISSLADIGPGGGAPDGEVEDYKVYIEKEWDLGDAPDEPGALGYPTLLANNGAYHVIGGPWFGDDNDMPDVDPDGQPDATATGDDNDGNDDEDGVQIPALTLNTTSTVTVQVNGGGGYVTVWIDWDGNMSWTDAGEMVYQSASPLGDGNHNISVTPPSSSVIGQTFLRARISTLFGLPSDLGAPDGEVEDHEVYIEEMPEELDYGDAPDSAAAMQYPTFFASDGARHAVVSGIMLGNQIDAELDGQPTSDADGDDLNNLDDEDGVQFTTPLVPGMYAKIDVTASIDGYLNAWIDYNGDFSWAEAGDHVFADEPIGMGTTTLGFTVPATATPGIVTYARFRFTSPNATVISYKGYALDGEVEDYKVKIDKPIIKWSQPPTYKDEDDECFWGWNEESVYGWRQIVADDWLCMDYRPITDIHWWGSYIGWNENVPPEPAPSRFHIGIWTDVPAGADVPWSHPGKMIWQWEVPREVLWERPVGCDFHEDYPDWLDTCFRYDLQLPEDVWFWQEGPETIYWISISARYADVEPPDEFEWGWKTREHYFNDDAVRIFNPTAPVVGDPFVSGEPIYDNAGTSWDMAFELTTQDVECFPDCHPDYGEWVVVGSPISWCFPRQCYGDTDNTESNYGPEPPPIVPWPKAWVTAEDLAVLVEGYKAVYGGDPEVDTWIAADFNHMENNYGPEPPPIVPWPAARVTAEDLSILVANYKAATVPADCLDCP